MPKTLFVIFLLTLLCVGTLSAQVPAWADAGKNTFGLLTRVKGNIVTISSFLIAPCLGENKEFLVVERFEGGQWMHVHSMVAETGMFATGYGRRELARLILPNGVYKVTSSLMRSGGQQGCVVGTSQWPVSHYEVALFLVGQPTEFPKIGDTSQFVVSAVVGDNLVVGTLTPRHHKSRTVVLQEQENVVRVVLDMVEQEESHFATWIDRKKLVQGVPVKVYVLDLVTGYSLTSVIPAHEWSRPDPFLLWK